MLSSKSAAANEYQSFDELSSVESLTFGTISDEIQQSSYNSEDEIGPKKVEAFLNDEESMTAVLEKAQMLVENEEPKVAQGTRVKVLPSKGNSAIIQIGTQVFVDYSGCCINKKWAEKQTMDLAQRQAILYQKYYLGPLTQKRAIEKCVIRSSWFLFHRVEVELSVAAASYTDRLQLPSSIPLFVVYRRNDNGEHEIYPIRSKLRSDKSSAYYVHYDDPTAPKFDSIYGLIQFYNDFGHANVHNSRSCDVEVFPLWKRPAPVPTISEYSALSSECSSIGDSIFDPTVTKSVSRATVVSGNFASSDEEETNCDL